MEWMSGVRCQGFGCQVSGKRNMEAETCWSEAAAGNTETSVIMNCLEFDLN